VTEKTTPSSDESEIARAGVLLRSGGLVAFPTETVYGLGANALDPAAVERIFEAKGRPATSPLIVHVASIHLARLIVAEWPVRADLLACRFWPGPLTLVLKKHANISERVTAGLDTVGIRVPAHPVALALLKAAGVPVAAPSANRFGGLSPTRAEHVRASLGDGVDMILDGGPTDVGIESTVLSIVDEPLLLRPGMITREQIEAVIGPVRVAGAPSADGEGHASPGMHPRHYSPSTPLCLIVSREPLPAGRGAYMYITSPRPGAKSAPMPNDPEKYAAALYQTLFELDAEGHDWIAVELPPDSPAWVAIRDRLSRAAAR
jgi:L-threonylcarbamoyladenylate synthase